MKGEKRARIFCKGLRNRGHWKMETSNDLILFSFYIQQRDVVKKSFIFMHVTEKNCILFVFKKSTNILKICPLNFKNKENKLQLGVER